MAEDAKEWIYQPVRDNSARFLLGEVDKSFDAGKEYMMVCIGINPSTAEPNDLDRTVAGVQRYAYEQQYKAWMMVNVYAQRATNPKYMHPERDDVLHREHIQYLSDYFSKIKKCRVWCAWGNIIDDRPYLWDCLRDIYAVLPRDSEFYTRGKRNRTGHPHHPLYLKKESPLDTFDMSVYLGIGTQRVKL